MATKRREKTQKKEEQREKFSADDADREGLFKPRKSALLSVIRFLPASQFLSFFVHFCASLWPNLFSRCAVSFPGTGVIFIQNTPTNDSTPTDNKTTPGTYK
jgi:hypothetical protein